MAYCTASDVVLECGTTLDADTVITPLITKSDKRIDASLADAGLTGTTDDDLEAASIHFTIAKIIDRDRLTQARTNSLSVPGLSIGNNTKNEIDYHESLAQEALARYIDRNTTGVSVSRTVPS